MTKKNFSCEYGWLHIDVCPGFKCKCGRICKPKEVVEEISFKKELTSLINRHSIENDSNTPDFLLANYLNKCLSAFAEAVQQREIWYFRDARTSKTAKPTDRQ